MILRRRLLRWFRAHPIVCVCKYRYHEWSERDTDLSYPYQVVYRRRCTREGCTAVWIEEPPNR